VRESVSRRRSPFILGSLGTWWRGGVAGAAVALAVALGAPSRAQSPDPASTDTRPTDTRPTDSGPTDPAALEVVARVGSSVVTRGELEKRLRETPPAALAELGRTPEEIRLKFLERVIVRDLLLAEEAKARGLDSDPSVREKLLIFQRLSLVQALRRETKADSISTDEIKAYYDANPQKFQMPRRLGVHHVSVATKEEAEAILAEVGESPDVKEWGEIARERSLDKDTNLRGGNLGLLTEAGETGEGERRVDPAIFRAADQVRDGEVVPEPVKVGNKWSVVWRRQSVAASNRSLLAETPKIRATISDERVRAAVTQLLEQLRSTVTEKNPELVGLVEVSSDGSLEPPRRPGTFPRAKRAADPKVKDEPSGLR
jgi:peptidyl-prolyl cis-trans isomerase C